MAETKKKFPKFTTPKGVFKFPKLNEPDTKFKQEGEYSVKLVLDAAAAEQLIDKLAPLYAEAIEEGKKKYAELPVANRKKLEAKGGFTPNPFCAPVYDDNAEETGEVEFKFAMKASGVSKKTGKPWTRRPVVFSASGKLLTQVPAIWGGTVGKVSFQAVPYFVPATGAAGLSLKLEAVQILELAGPNSRSASHYGFGAEEGYEPDADEPEAPASDAGGAESGEDSGSDADADDATDF